MPFTWNSSPQYIFPSAVLSVLLLLLPGTHTDAQANTHTKSETTQKPAADTKRTSLKKPIAKKATAKVSAQKTHLAPRQNLRTPKHAIPSVQVSLRGTHGASSVQRTAASIAPLATQPMLRSEIAFVQDLESADILYDKNSDEVRPIASITKLMTALVVAEAGLPLNELLQISDADVDRVRHSRSRLRVGTELSRADMLHLALMSSENRAAHALGRYYPGGMPAFVRAMNDKARALGMRNTHFIEPTGLASDNVSTPRDLVKLLRAVSKQPLIRRYTTDEKYQVEAANGRQLLYNNTNRLVSNSDWDIQISKTGFINEAGECLVMLTRIDNRDLAIVLLNSSGRYSRIGDAVRIRTLVESANNVAML